MGDFIVLAILAVVVGLCLRSVIRARKHGGCGCGCSGCSGSCGCHPVEQAKPKETKADK